MINSTCPQLADEITVEATKRRLFCAFLHLFCGRMPRQRVEQVATCPRNELIVSRDAHMYAVDWLSVWNTKVHFGELRLDEASLRALFASLIKSYDCTRYLLTSSYATYTCDRWIRMSLQRRSSVGFPFTSFSQDRLRHCRMTLNFG